MKRSEMYLQMSRGIEFYLSCIHECSKLVSFEIVRFTLPNLSLFPHAGLMMRPLIFENFENHQLHLPCRV